jgi:4-diphosphocytidyl-2C-methyl-D-erythritol kinase
VQAVDVPPLHVAVAMTTPSVTGDVYAGLLPEERAGDGRVSRLAATLLGGTPDTTLFGSALEASASRANPDLGRSLERARAVTPGHDWHLTGSGGAVFAIASDGAQAGSLAAAMTDAGFAARACRTIAVAGVA